MRMLSDGTERPATDSEVSRVRRSITDASPQAPSAGAAAGAEERCAGAAGACKHEVGVRPHLQALPLCHVPRTFHRGHEHSCATKLTRAMNSAGSALQVRHPFCHSPVSFWHASLWTRPGADLHLPSCQGASEAAEAPDMALATPAAGAAVGALARLPQPAALKFLRQMRPGVAQAALAALQACALLRTRCHSHEIT